MQKKIKAVVKERPQGTKYDVYKNWFGIWLWSHGYAPITDDFWLIEEDIDRLIRVYGDALLIEDCLTRGGIPVTGKGRFLSELLGDKQLPQQ